MASYTEDQLRRNADLKLWIEERIAELQEEMDRLKEALAVVDTALRASSFRPAAEVSSPPLTAGTAAGREGGGQGRGRQLPREDEEASEIPEIKELKRDKGGGGETIAVAQLTRKTVKIEPVAEVALRADTPPFKSFLLGKILSGMKVSDEEAISKGKLKKGEEMKFNITERNGNISAITVENYREKERLSEILSTTAWTFSRMMEK